jgi:predicted dehydrogenase
VIYVATPHHDHFPSARRCLEAGKAVLVEKPLTVSPAEAEELIMLAGQRRLFLMEAMWMRTQPLIRKAVEIVDSGVLGAVRHVSASFGFAFDGGPSHRLLDPGQAGGAILDLGVYPVHAAHLHHHATAARPRGNGSAALQPGNRSADKARGSLQRRPGDHRRLLHLAARDHHRPAARTPSRRC